MKFIRDGDSPLCGAYYKGMSVPTGLSADVVERWREQGIIEGKPQEPIKKIETKKQGVTSNGRK